MALEPPNTTSLLEGPERLIGSRVLDFELMGVLGAGGMSVVYRGVHRVTGQEVAVKVLPPELAIHDELKARFVEEARLLALLEHPNIVTLNNFTEAGGRLCLVMQFVEGATFEARVQELKRVPWEEAARVGIEVLRALEHAHKQGVIHRDIKPSNVLVRTDGTIKVTDFGIAKMVGQSRLTSTGQTMGTVRYMSPEQVRGRPLDVRSDLYSLGVTLFEGLAGKTPFDGDNQFAIMDQHLHKPAPSLASFGVRIPQSLEEVLHRSLEKNADDRFADATQFREALELVVRGERPVMPAPSSTRARNRRILVAAVALCVIGGAIGVVVQMFLVKPSAVVGPVAPVASSKPPKPATASASGVPAGWVAPHVVPDLKLATDQRMPEANIRIQSARRLETTELLDLTHRYQSLGRELAGFIAGEPVAGAALKASTSPLNLVLVPDFVLNDPRRWPGYHVEAGHSYGSRYDQDTRTLFVADGAHFADRELPYGVALHVLTPIDALSNEAVYDLADRFAAQHLKLAPDAK